MTAGGSHGEHSGAYTSRDLPQSHPALGTVQGWLDLKPESHGQGVLDLLPLRGRLKKVSESPGQSAPSLFCKMGMMIMHTERGGAMIYLGNEVPIRLRRRTLLGSG